MSDYEKKWNEAMKEVVRLRAYETILRDCMKQIWNKGKGIPEIDATYVAEEALRMTTLESEWALLQASEEP